MPRTNIYCDCDEYYGAALYDAKTSEEEAEFDDMFEDMFVEELNGNDSSLFPSISVDPGDVWDITLKQIVPYIS